MAGVLVYSDSSDSALELVTLGSKLGREVSVVVLGSEDLSDQTKKVSVNGVSTVYQISSDALSNLLAGPTVDALESVYSRVSPDYMFFSSTKKGKELAPRLAARLKIGCITDAMKPELNENGITAERLVLGGNAIATVASRGPAVATIPLRAFERASGNASPNVIKIEDFQPRPTRTIVLGRKEKQKGQVNIKDAEIIVSAGRGFKKKEDLAILEELAKVLNAVVGASRPLTSDLGWLPEDRQVGLSGTTVKPKLYIAVGISGQIQHLTGMRESKLVVAINTDKNAPIFQECDYGIVGDLYAIIPELTKDLKLQLGR
ncbi:MAG: electron transfer flavoprotein subunit alpha/FixB family protein [Thaumarchaeota archaeon]|nr:electron transfer flavoprotein subunit alpha/FixB family protein [Nitrososphaerota archaeon]